MSIFSSVEQLIGETPLVELSNIERQENLSSKIIAKLEFLNPGGSVKDRVAKEMIDTAENLGLLKAGGTIIEPTSGNTGIGLAMIATSRGYKAIIVMPETMSIERRLLMQAYGAEVVLTDGTKGMQGAIDKAKELQKNIPNSFMPDQFSNPANYGAHIKTTGPEIYNGMAGKIDIFVAGVGTGGTISGVGKYLKEQNPNIKVIAVEPETSAVLSGRSAGSHGIQGIGAGFIPKTLLRESYDEVLTVKDEDAYSAGRMLATKEGLLVGISSGAAFSVALKLAKLPENTTKNIVVLLPDSGERYLSTPMFSR